MFICKMADADGEATETQVWLDFALKCNYLSKERHNDLIKGYKVMRKQEECLVV